ncbi:MAG: hypothetical protein HY692_06910 [Cyanobacteria bacterium NC_groundwater_1444_Ag_S-0.65um_54_12]|nr:hypothetical protein [Cyanobacteria bacterium NC_groundwater_1444_Ag_S-0.65um_54_12]
MKRVAAEGSLPVIQEAAASFFEEEDILLAEQAGPGNLKLIEGLLHAAPDNSGLGAVAAQLFCSYAFGFLEPVAGPYDTPDPAQIARTKAFYLRGRDYGMRVLQKNPSFRETLTADIATFRATLQSFSLTDAPALFWTAYGWGQLINLSKDEPERVAELPRVVALMDRVDELDPAFYHGGVHAFRMVNAAARAPLLGGQPEVAKRAHERANSITGGNFFLYDVLFAQYYAVQVQDAKLFQETLQRVIATTADVMPSERLANRLAQKRAQILLSKMVDFFPDLEDEEGP